MKQKIGKGAAAFITIILLFIAPVVIMDTAYAADTIITKTNSDEVKQSKNIQNKTDIDIKKQTILSRLLSVGSEYTLKTNLEDSFTMRSSKKTFDVWARKGGVKMPACATLSRLNSAEEEKYVGEINVAWDDGNKSSFTLDMSSQARGDFLIKVWTGGDSIENASVIKAYHFTYEKTPKGGYIGDIVIDIEAFTISLGYLEEPERLPIYEGDNSATVIDRYLKSKGYTYESTGSVESGFYLGRIRGLKSIDLSKAKLESTVATVVDNDEWNQNDYEEGSLGEKDFTAYSGWMYSVNNVFPNVGFSEFYFQPDDVVRIQFTVATGREIGGSGGSGGTGSDYYSVADKDELTALLANINSSINSTQIKDDQKAAGLIAQAIEFCQEIAVDQDDIDVITDEINDYLGKNSESPTIELNTAGITLKKGNTQKVEATVGDITTLSPLFLRWDSEEPEIATVDSVGNITAQSSGTTVITVSIGGSSASCNVTVEEIPLEGIKLVPVTLWSEGTDPYMEYKTENGYRFPTNIYPDFMIEPVPSDTTDDLTPQYTLNTKKYMDLTVIQDKINRCCLIGKHEGTSILTARVGEYSDQLEIEYYENKVTSFTCDDPEPALSINGYGAVTRKVLTFTTDPSKAQDSSSVYFASSDSSVFIVNEPLEIEGSGSVIKKTIYARGEGVADLYVTIGNITRTYPVTVYDLNESDEIVPNGYDKFSQVYLSSDTNKAIEWIGGYRYRAGKQFRGTNDAKQFGISLNDPNEILSFNGVSYTSNEFVCSGVGQDIYARTYIWPLPTFTGSTGTAIFTNKMFGKERMLTKITVADEVVHAESVQISNGKDTNTECVYNINDTIDLQCSVSPENATGEIVWYSSDQNVATVNQNGRVRITGYGDTDIVACIAGKYAVYTIRVEQPMTGMTISNEELNLTSGISRKLMAWCVPNNTTDDHTITWESSDSDVVSVNSNGKITTHKEGEATITARTEKHTVTCHVIVDDQKLRQLYFPKSPVYIEVGETINVGAPQTVPESAYSEASEYTWSSSDESYASVDQEGNVTLHKASPVDRAGTLITNEDYYNNRVKVYAEKDGVRGTCAIQTGSPMTGLDMSSREITIYKGDEVELEALFLPEDTTENRGGITWKSSNGLIVSQRAMDGNFNEFKRLIVGLILGEATITATCGEFSASCRVKVVLPEDQQAAYDLQKKIEGWTDLDPVADRADYVRIGLEIQETWETFTDAQKRLVGGYNEYFDEHLEEIREMAASDQRVADVVSLIDSIGEVTLSDESQAKITSAREAYNALTDDEKARFDADVLKTLTDAETRLAELRDEADRKAREANDLRLKIERWAQLDPVLNRTEYISTGLEIQDTWESFADDQKEMVPGYNTLFAPHLDEIREMAASDQRVADVVSLIGSIGEVNLDDTSQAKINAAREGFDALTGEEKARVGADTLKVLTDAEEKISQLQEEENRKTQAALDLQNKIEQWTALDPVTDRDEYVKTGLEIQVAWESFTDAQKALVPGYEASFAPHLEEIKKMAESDKKVADVISLIDSIGDVTLDDACRAKIDAARKAFDALTDEQKDKVGLRKLQVLIDAELRIKELQKEADKQETIRKKKAAAKKLKIKGLKVKAKSRKFTLTWKKTKGASGYQIQYRKKGAKKFSSLKTTKLKVRTKKLKKNKKYQFRVRTYIKIEGKPVYGKWTKIKTVKCK